jgi:hypothetical protein
VKVKSEIIEKYFEDEIAVSNLGDYPSHQLRFRRKTTVRAYRQAWAVIRKNTDSVPEALGFSSPLVVGWELVPFSFVVDWFCSIGQWLEAADSLMNVSVVDTGSDYVVDRSTDIEPIMVKTQVSGWSNSMDHKNRILIRPVRGQLPHFVERDYVRVANAGIPLPPPVIKNPLGFSHMVTTLALWRQRR